MIVFSPCAKIKKLGERTHNHLKVASELFLKYQDKPEDIIQKSAIINYPPLIDDEKKSNPAYAGGEYLMTGLVFGLPRISIKEMAGIIEDEDTKMFVVELTASAAIASLLIQSYRFIKLRGPQNALAAIVPPRTVEGLVGRSGYRVPPHEIYTLSDVQNLAHFVSAANTKEEVMSLLQKTDPELLTYLSVVTDYARRGRVLEELEWKRSCPALSLCL